ncbi:MAG: O-antigen ligase family protein [Vicinamibacterales bacterium]
MRLSDWSVRLFVALALVAVLAYPVRALWGLAELPIVVKALWAAALVGAFIAPRPSLLVFLVGAPLTPSLPSIFKWPAVSLAELWLFALLIPFWTRWLSRPPATKVPTAALLLALLATGSLVVALFPLHLAFESIPQWLMALHEYARDDLLTSVSQRHLYSSVLAWVVLVEGLALLWLVVDHFADATDEDLHHLALALALGCAGVAAFGLYQRWSGRHLLAFWRQVDPFLVRINSTFTDVNALGSYLVSMLPIVGASALLARSRDERLWWTGVGAATVAATVLTGSRAAWAAIVLSGGVALLLALRAERPRWLQSAERARRLVAGGVLVTLAMVAVLSVMGTARNFRHEQVRNYGDALLYTFNLRLPLQERLKGRTALWGAAVRMVAGQPLTGVGIGRYYKDLASYVPDSEYLIRPQENAHNYFLQVAAELGLPGLLLLVSLIALPLWTMRRSFDPNVSRARRLIACGAGTGVLAHVLTWLTGHPLLIRDGQLTFWPLVGLVLVCAPAPVALDWRWRWPRWVVATTALAFVVSVPVRAATEVDRIDLSRVPLGVYDPEVDREGQSFRWTRDRAVVYIPTTARTFVLPVRSLAPFTQKVQVLRNGVVVDELELADHNWRTFRYQLTVASGATRRFHRFELRVSPSWTPPNDGRLLGVVIGELSWD